MNFEMKETYTSGKADGKKKKKNVFSQCYEKIIEGFTILIVFRILI